jgi:hypothetical protein
MDKEGKRVAMSVQPGDKVLIPQVRMRSKYRSKEAQELENEEM